MVLDNYRWHYNYVRLAWDSGFTFEKYKQSNGDKNKICSVDVDRIIRERDVALVDHHISTVVEYVLDKEQAEVLDTNFVKIFRMGQLAVEYLLFCKKYLDNTVVLLKKDMAKLKEEADELRLYTTELEAVMKQNLSTTFKCDKCPKMFSTQEFLTAHSRRRHNLERFPAESDSLQTEVKRLKERLNETEKYLKEKTEKVGTHRPSPAHAYADINEQVQEIQDKFERFKKMVESDIANIQAEKKGYEEKYSSLLDIVVHNVKKDSGSPSKESIPVSKERFDMTTQTETGKKLSAENTHDKHVILCEDTDKGAEVNEKIEEKINEIGTTIESKISIGFTSIEQQMSSLFERLQELENKQPEPVPMADNNPSPAKSEAPKPRAKPRSKLTQPTVSSPTKNDDTQARQLKDELEAMLATRNAIAANEVQESLVEENLEISMADSDQSETSEDSSEESLPIAKASISPKLDATSKNPRSYPTKKVEIVPTTIIKSMPVSSSKDKSGYNSRKISAKLEDILKDTEESESDMEDNKMSQSRKDQLRQPKKDPQKVVKKVTIKDIETEDDTDSAKTCTKEDVQKRLKSKLQDIGISMDWRGIPKATLQRALETVTHQADLNKKVHPHFNRLRKSIEKSVAKEIQKKAPR